MSLNWKQGTTGELSLQGLYVGVITQLPIGEPSGNHRGT